MFCLFSPAIAYFHMLFHAHFRPGTRLLLRDRCVRGCTTGRAGLLLSSADVESASSFCAHNIIIRVANSSPEQKQTVLLSCSSALVALAQAEIADSKSSLF